MRRMTTRLVIVSLAAVCVARAEEDAADSRGRSTEPSSETTRVDGLVVEPAELNLGEIDGTTTLSRTVTLKSRLAQVGVLRVMASCSCVSAKVAGDLALPVELGPEGLAISVTVDPTTYEGAFRKQIYISYHVAGESDNRMLSIPVSGTVKGDASWEAALAAVGATTPEVAKPSTTMPSIIPVTEAMPDDTLLAGMTMFLSPTCDLCHWVKLQWLPEIVARGYAGQIYEVDITKDAGVKRLLRLEERLKVVEPGASAPAVVYNGRILYGTLDISRLALVGETSLVPTTNVPEGPTSKPIGEAVDATPVEQPGDTQATP